MADIDPELRALAQAHIADEYDLPAGARQRIRGDDLRSMRADAKLLREELGLRPLNERGRDAGGRFSGAVADMNSAIRHAAGR
jgi:hypothetical protein